MGISRVCLCCTDLRANAAPSHARANDACLLSLKSNLTLALEAMARRTPCATPSTHDYPTVVTVFRALTLGSTAARGWGCRSTGVLGTPGSSSAIVCGSGCARITVATSDPSPTAVAATATTVATTTTSVTTPASSALPVGTAAASPSAVNSAVHSQPISAHFAALHVVRGGGGRRGVCDCARPAAVAEALAAQAVHVVAARDALDELVARGALLGVVLQPLGVVGVGKEFSRLDGEVGTHDLAEPRSDAGVGQPCDVVWAEPARAPFAGAAHCRLAL
jgi:hypothetical protein